MTPAQNIPPSQSPQWLSEHMDDIEPSALQHTMGLQNIGLANQLLANQSISLLLGRDLCRRLDADAGALPKLSAQDKRVYEALVWMPSRQITHQARALAILFNRRAAFSITSREAIADVLKWGAVPGLYPHLRSSTLPDFDVIDAAASFTPQDLEPYADTLEPFLTDILPERFFVQRCLRLGGASRPNRTAFDAKSPMRPVLIAALDVTVELARSSEVDNEAP